MMPAVQVSGLDAGGLLSEVMAHEDAVALQMLAQHPKPSGVSTNSPQNDADAGQTREQTFADSKLDDELEELMLQQVAALLG